MFRWTLPGILRAHRARRYLLHCARGTSAAASVKITRPIILILGWAAVALCSSLLAICAIPSPSFVCRLSHAYLIPINIASSDCFSPAQQEQAKAIYSAAAPLSFSSRLINGEWIMSTGFNVHTGCICIDRLVSWPVRYNCKPLVEAEFLHVVMALEYTVRADMGGVCCLNKRESYAQASRLQSTRGNVHPSPPPLVRA